MKYAVFNKYGLVGVFTEKKQANSYKNPNTAILRVLSDDAADEIGHIGLEVCKKLKVLFPFSAVVIQEEHRVPKVVFESLLGVTGKPQEQ